jgi:hypothetical protein
MRYSGRKRVYQADVVHGVVTIGSWASAPNVGLYSLLEAQDLSYTRIAVLSVAATCSSQV